jgi:prepilin-type N-terminal cleavage/methylation domain-containing protein
LERDDKEPFGLPWKSGRPERRLVFLGTPHHRCLSNAGKQENACPLTHPDETFPVKLFSHQHHVTRHGFTIIELLVVIMIIAILASIAMPAMNNAFNSAKKTTAKNQAVQIATAITAYETEYGRLPAFIGSNMVKTNINMLTAADSNNNPRGISFIEVSAWKPGKGGTNTSGDFCDPFSSSNAYSVALDTNYSNILSNMPSQSGYGSTVTYSNTLTKHIAVWTVWTNGSKQILVNSWD